MFKVPYWSAGGLRVGSDAFPAGLEWICCPNSALEKPNLLLQPGDGRSKHHGQRGEYCFPVKELRYGAKDGVFKD